MTHITTLKVRSRSFEIVKDEKGFWAIEDKYITDGKLNCQINGITGNLRDTLEACIESARNHAEIEYLISEGWDRLEAIQHVIMGEA